MAIAISGVRVWDGFADETPRERVTIRIEEDRLAAIGATPDLAANAERYAFESDPVRPGMPARASGTREEAGGAGGPTAIPGLIDAHVHMTLDPALVDPRKQLTSPAEELEAALRSRARAMLCAGITTARDLGGGAWTELALRDRIARGEIPRRHLFRHHRAPPSPRRKTPNCRTAWSNWSSRPPL